MQSSLRQCCGGGVGVLSIETWTCPESDSLLAENLAHDTVVAQAAHAAEARLPLLHASSLKASKTARVRNK